MVYLYTLSSASQPGECFGDLRLFFTLLNPADYTPTAPPGMWTAGGIAETLNLPNGDVLNLTFRTANNGLPSIIYPVYVVNFVPHGGSPIQAGPLGQSTAAFVQNQPVATKWSGETSGSTAGYAWTAGFIVDIPWDGTSADCAGMWWFKWKSAQA